MLRERPSTIGLLVALALAGCAGSKDEDGDGFIASEDCDDNNPDINPDATEVCNGVDDDCDASTIEAGMASVGTGSDRVDATERFRGGDDGAPLALTLDEPDTYAFCPGVWDLSLTITEEVELVGFGDVDAIILSAGEAGRVVEVSGPDADVRIAGLTLAEGAAGEEQAGGGLRCTDGATVELVDAVVRNSTASAGAGIAVEGCDATLLGVRVVGNEAPIGAGAISYPFVLGGNSLFMEDSTVADNVGNGIDIVAYGATIRRSEFRGNTGVGLIAAVSDPDPDFELEIEDSVFSDNGAQGMILDEIGLDDPLRGLQFSGNTAAEDGGGAWISGLRGEWVDGEYVDPPESVHLIDCTFTDNVAAERGGGVFFDGLEPTLEGCTFQGNSAVEDGGGLYTAEDLTLVDSTFVGNSAEYGGGAYLTRADLDVEGGRFTGNAASARGGGIYVFEGESRIDGTEFRENTAATEGGAIVFRDYELPPDEVTVSGAGFYDNEAGSGGAVADYRVDSQYADCVFQGNTADEGGAITSGLGRVRLEDTMFLENEAEERGGAIYALRGTPSELYGEGMTFDDNTPEDIMYSTTAFDVGDDTSFECDNGCSAGAR